MELVAFTGIYLHVATICTILIEMGREWAAEGEEGIKLETRKQKLEVGGEWAALFR
jgi:hypothetical protein